MLYIAGYLVAGYLINLQVFPLSFAEKSLSQKAIDVAIWPVRLAQYAMNAQ